MCTLGPSSSSIEIIERLAKRGMDCARLNFSHGTLDEHLATIKNVREISRNLGKRIAIMQDLPGPKIRVGKIEGGSVSLKRGQGVQLVSDEDENIVVGKDVVIPVHRLNLAKYVAERSMIFLADGSIRLVVIRKTKSLLYCRCLNSGTLLSGKGINIPELQRSFLGFTKQDQEFLRFGIQNKVDLVAVSFVRAANEIARVRDFMAHLTTRPPWIVTKIERREAVVNASSLIGVSDAVMVARGDLGVENPLELVPVIQKMIISECNKLAIPVITATQMLESMVGNPRPTRAETTDVANAVFDGTDALMLSEETAVGSFPLDCVKVLDRVAKVAEKWQEDHNVFEQFVRPGPHSSLGSGIGGATVRLARETMSNLIVCLTASGTLARQISREKPAAAIVTISDESVANRLKIVRDVYPLVAPRSLFHSPSTRLLRLSISETLLDSNIAKPNDKIVFVSNVMNEEGLKKGKGSSESAVLLAHTVKARDK